MTNEQVKQLLEQMAAVMRRNKELLIELDSVAGDGDLGLTMSDGFTAASDAARQSEEHDIGKLLYQSGKAMANKVPSTMGTLMASGFMEAGKALKGKEALTASDVIRLFEAYAEGVQKRGKAKIGEKTFLDGLYPAVLRMKEMQTDDLAKLAIAAREAAVAGYESTSAMIAVHGRAATRGEKSRDMKDPGAKVAALMMEAFMEMTAL